MRLMSMLLLMMGLLVSTDVATQETRNLFDAGRIALDDDASELQGEEPHNLELDQDLVRYVRDIAHYAVGLSYRAKGVEVESVLKKHPTRAIMGGGGHSLIDRDTLKILEKRRYE